MQIKRWKHVYIIKKNSEMTNNVANIFKQYYFLWLSVNKFWVQLYVVFSFSINKSGFLMWFKYFILSLFGVWFCIRHYNSIVRLVKNLSYF